MSFDVSDHCCRFNPQSPKCGDPDSVINISGLVRVDLSKSTFHKRAFRTVYCLETGGTFSSVPSDAGYLPGYHLPQLLNEFVKLDDRDLLGFCFPAPGSDKHFGKLLDSTNIKLADQIRLANLIEEVLQHDQHCGIIITHGTDTMSFTASMLSLLIPNPTKPIILTGAMRGFTEQDSDAPRNFKDAASVVNCGDIQPGVYVVFNGRIIPGAWVTKLGLDDVDSFRSIYSGQDIGKVNQGVVTLECNMKQGSETPDKVIIKDNAIPITEVLVDTIVIHPGLSPKQLDSRLSTSIGHGVIIRGYGSGAIPDDLLPILKKYAVSKPILVDTQVPLRGIGGAKYEVEESVLRAGIMTAQGLSQAMALNAFSMVLAEHGSDLKSIKLAWSVICQRWGSGPVMPATDQVSNN